MSAAEPAGPHPPPSRRRARTRPTRRTGRARRRPGGRTPLPAAARPRRPGRLLGYARPYRTPDRARRRAAARRRRLETALSAPHAARHRPLHPGPRSAGLGLLSLALPRRCWSGSSALRYLQMVLTQATGQRITTDLRDSLFAHLQRLDQAYFEKNPVGRIMTRLTGDVEALNDLFTSGLVSIFGDVVTLFGIAGVLFWLNPRLALVALTVVPLLLAGDDGLPRARPHRLRPHPRAGRRHQRLPAGVDRRGSRWCSSSTARRSTRRSSPS